MWKRTFIEVFKDRPIPIHCNRISRSQKYHMSKRGRNWNMLSLETKTSSKVLSRHLAFSFLPKHLKQPVSYQTMDISFFAFLPKTLQKALLFLSNKVASQYQSQVVKPFIPESNSISNIAKMAIFTDASIKGWGATCGIHTAQGTWTMDQRKKGTFWWEAKAAILSIEHFTRGITSQEIAVYSDCTSAVAILNGNRPSKKKKTKSLSNELLSLKWSRSLQIQAHHLPRELNFSPDSLSRGKPVSKIKDLILKTSDLHQYFEVPNSVTFIGCHDGLHQGETLHRDPGKWTIPKTSYIITASTPDIPIVWRMLQEWEPCSKEGWLIFPSFETSYLQNIKQMHGSVIITEKAKWVIAGSKVQWTIIHRLQQP